MNTFLRTALRHDSILLLLNVEEWASLNQILHLNQDLKGEELAK